MFLLPGHVLSNALTSVGNTGTVPYGPGKRGEHWAGRDVCGLPPGPVIRGERPGDGALSQSNGEINQPEEDQQITELEDEDVAMVQALTPVKGKKALSTWTLLGDVGPVEALLIMKKHSHAKPSPMM